MPYYPGEIPPSDGNYGYLDDFDVAQANHYANSQFQPPPQYYGQPQPHYYPQQQPPPQQHLPQYNPQSQPMHQRLSQVEVVIPPFSSQPYRQPKAVTTQLMDVNTRVLQDVSVSNFPRQSGNSKVEVKAPPSVIDELDYGLLLLTLADEYLEAAHSLPHTAPEYYRLVATALGCLESVLNSFRLEPIKEAHVCLRYAQILFDETDNNDEIEKVLTKSIELCERNHFFDLKYTMQALLVEALYRSKPKAAMKDLQSMIEDVEAYRRAAWEYNFRFLSASLSMSASPSSHDFHSATSQFEKICTVANHNGDYAIYAFASILQALVALQASGPDAVTTAQRSLARAKQLQLNPDVSEQVHMQILMQFIDLACSLQESGPKLLETKMQFMQQILYERMEHPNWHDDGTIYLPVLKRSLNNTVLQEGGTVVERDGKTYLTFRWLTKATVEVVGYLLSATSVSYKNASDGGKAAKYLGEGLKLLRTETSKVASAQSPRQTIERRSLECCFLIDNAFLLCGKGEWASARAIVDEVFVLARGLLGALPAEIICFAKYLEGAIYQATGDHATALRIFQGATFALPQVAADPSSAKKSGRPSGSSKGQQDSTVRKICLLAAMNSILIVRSPSHPQYHILEPLLASIEPLIVATPNKSIQASYSLILSTLAESSITILKTKQHLGNALSAGQLCGNAQVTALTLILMSDKFFKGVVGEQAMKCAKAASHQARRSGDPLWLSVAQGMEAECLEIMGKSEEARKIGDAARKLTTELPQGILREL